MPRKHDGNRFELAAAVVLPGRGALVIMGGMRTVFEAAGGIDGLRRLAAAWHRRVMADEVVGHAFSHGFPSAAC